MVPVILAGLLTELASKGLSMLGNAVLAKGKDVVEKELGVDLSKSVQSEEGLIKLRELTMKHEEFLLDISAKAADRELAEVTMINSNTADAREANVKIQESSSASSLAKNMAYWIDGFIVVATFCLAYLLLIKAIPVENKEVFYTAFGSLLSLCLTIVNFHRGSSANNRGKDETINRLSGGSK